MMLCGRTRCWTYLLVKLRSFSIRIAPRKTSANEGMSHFSQTQLTVFLLLIIILYKSSVQAQLCTHINMCECNPLELYK